MAKTTALSQLQEQIDAVRQEAFAAGYAAAMEAIRELASRPAPGSETAPQQPQRRQRSAQAAQPAQPAASGAPRRPRAARAQTRATGRSGGARSGGGQRPQRGTNARLVEEVLQSVAPRAVRPAEIRSALQREKGVSMAFTSIRHALGQLEARRAVEQVDDSNSWRYREGGSNAAASD